MTAHGIQRLRLADQAYDVLRTWVVTGRLAPGARLSVPALAEELGLSRSPVREAVQRLVQEGLGTERPHSGAVVSTPDLAGLVDLYRVRATLEGLGAELAVEHADGDGGGLVADLERIHAEHEAAFRADVPARVIESDIAFHARLLQGTASPELQRTLEPILRRMALAMVAGDPGSWPARALVEHAAVLAAVREGDGARARQSMVAHVLRVREGLLGKLEAARVTPGGSRS